MKPQSYKIQGELVQKDQGRNVSSTQNEFWIRNFVLRQDGNKEDNFVSMQVSGSKEDVSVLDSFMEGTILDVQFFLNGRWNDKFNKYFTNINAWKIDINQEAKNPPQEQGGQAPSRGEAHPSPYPPSSNPVSNPNTAFDDDLPF